MDSRFEALLTPEAEAYRKKKIEQGRYYGGDYNHGYYQAKQEQDVLAAREKIEELATRIKAHKEEGDKILEWMKEQDIPGVDCWVWSLSEIEDNDIVGDAIRWAASNHNC